jgi:hypothetical protein
MRLRAPFDELYRGARQRGMGHTAAVVSSSVMLLLLGICIFVGAFALAIVAFDDQYDDVRSIGFAGLMVFALVVITLFVGHRIRWTPLIKLMWWGSAAAAILVTITINAYLVGMLILAAGQLVVLVGAIASGKSRN